MSRTVPVAAAAVLLAGLAWSARLAFGPAPWGEGAAALVAADLLLVTAVTVVAILLAPARWVRRLVAAVAGVQAALAMVLSVDALWVGAAALTLVAAGLSWSAWLDEWFRGRVKADQVPARATALALGLLVLPGVVGAAGLPTVTTAGWAVAVAAAVLAWAYSRALPGTLWIARLAVLPAAVAAAIGLDLVPGMVLVAAGVALTALAWTADARLAVQPLAPKRVEAVSILPEMVPEDLMEGAGYDRRGRRKDRP